MANKLTGNFDDFVATVTGLTQSDSVRVSNAIFKNVFEVSDFTKSHFIQTGVKDGEAITIISDEVDYTAMPYMDKNSCAPAEACKTNLNLSKAIWNLQQFGCSLDICMKEFEQEFAIFWNFFKVYNPKGADINNAYVQFIIKQIIKNRLGAQWRNAWYSDTSSSLPYLNAQDGFLVQAQAQYGANSNLKTTITENSNTTYTAQKLTGEQAYNYYLDIVKKAQDLPAFYAHKDWAIKTTQFMAQPFVNWLNENSTLAPGFCTKVLDPTKIQQESAWTIENVRVNGIPLAVHRELDGVINQIPTLNGGGGDNPRVNPNFALLTHKSNLRIGTSDQRDLNFFKSGFEDKKDNLWIKTTSTMDSKLVTDDFIIAI